MRVEDPVKLTEVRQKITDLGFGSFSIIDEIDQIRTVFLIIDSVLGLLGGISLLVASFGIANTMIMSILERTRELGVPRYNTFRELLHKPPVRTFAELTTNREWAEEIEQVYGGDIDRVDVTVGLFAEHPPEGFGFSDTAFRIFVLMASRRLNSDRFFTSDYTAAVYTQAGLDWIDANTMSSVLRRHYPGVASVMSSVGNAFHPWKRAAG